MGASSVCPPFLHFQLTDIIRQDLRSTRLYHHGVLDAYPPGAGVEAAVSDGDDHIGRQRRRRLLAVEKGVAGRQGRLRCCCRKVPVGGCSGCPARMRDRVNVFYIPVFYNSTRLSLSELPITETELKLMAAAAIMGDNRIPKKGYNTPAAMGTPAVL